MGWFKWLLLLINAVCVGGLIAGYLSPFVSPASFWYLALAGLAYFWLLLLNLLFAVYWLFVRWKISVALWLILAAGYTYHVRVFSPYSNQRSPVKNEREVKVMTYNVQLFKLYNWTKNKDIRNQIISFLASENADILCMQEYFYADKSFFNTTDTLLQLLETKNYHFEPGVITEQNHYFGLATFSRFPIIRSEVFHFDHHNNRTNLAMYNDMIIYGDTVRVYNVHLASNHLNTKEVKDILEADQKSWGITKSWLKKLRNGYDLRVKQMKDITRSMRNSPHPLIVCGDFNDVPVSYTYREMSRGLKDAFTGSGKGLGATYNGNIPNLRIDYIFHDPAFRSHQFKVLHKNFTDHFPVTCKISLP